MPISPEHQQMTSELQELDQQIQALDLDQSSNSALGVKGIQSRLLLLAKRMDINRKFSRIPPIQEQTLYSVWNSTAFQERINTATNAEFATTSASALATPFIQAVEKTLNPGHIMMSVALGVVGHGATRDPRALHWKELSSDVDSKTAHLSHRHKAILFLIMMQSEAASQTNQLISAFKQSSNGIGSTLGSENSYWQSKLIGTDKDAGLGFYIGYYQRMSGLTQLLLSEQYPLQEQLASDLWFAVAFLKTSNMKKNNLDISHIRQSIFSHISGGRLESALQELQELLVHYPASLSPQLAQKLHVNPDDVLIRRYGLQNGMHLSPESRALNAAQLRLTEFEQQTNPKEVENVRQQLNTVFSVVSEMPWGNLPGSSTQIFYEVRRIVTVPEQIPSISGNVVTYKTINASRVELARLIKTQRGYSDTKQRFYWYPKRVNEAILNYTLFRRRD